MVGSCHLCQLQAQIIVSGTIHDTGQIIPTLVNGSLLSCRWITKVAIIGRYASAVSLDIVCLQRH